jgi:hypothetical protein
METADVCPSCQASYTYVKDAKVVCAFCSTYIRPYNKALDSQLPEKKARPKQTPKPWIYGLHRVRNHLAIFVAKKSREASIREHYNVIALYEVMARNVDECWGIAKKALANRVEAPPAPPDRFAPGTVLRHYDGCSEHWAILLEVEGVQAHVLFLTSNPFWSERSRVALPEEVALTGFISKRTTYFALATRPLADFASLRLTYPQHRLEDLREEFLESTKSVDRVVVAA